VTALNVAGEGEFSDANMWLGTVPSEPLNPRLEAVTPSFSITIRWDHSLQDGCLSLLSYSVFMDGELTAS
jgi:hypothetical protein